MLCCAHSAQHQPRTPSQSLRQSSLFLCDLQNTPNITQHCSDQLNTTLPLHTHFANSISRFLLALSCCHLAASPSQSKQPKRAQGQLYRPEFTLGADQTKQFQQPPSKTTDLPPPESPQPTTLFSHTEEELLRASEREKDRLVSARVITIRHQKTSEQWSSQR